MSGQATGRWSDLPAGMGRMGTLLRKASTRLREVLASKRA